ncbi:MAG: PD-(D/E)XK nuclease family protein [Dysgonamonadaceae bacterium]|jgi:hypothetical protein|nr:PD-(D/E)XK nuclease family protein [Dysgonamonadaceae bacterium]
MNNIKEILEKLKDIEIKSNPMPFNMLYLAYQNVHAKEVLHSKLLAGLLNPNENHKLGDAPLKCFLHKIDVACGALQEVSVETEKNVNGRRIDIFVSWKDEDNESKKHAVIIENKLHNAGSQKNQLNAYYDGTKDEYSIEKIVYLPFDKSRGSFERTDIRSDLHEKCIDIDAKWIVKWLEDLIKDNEGISILEQYKEFFECLINTKFIYMKAKEIIDACSIEEINKLQNLANVANSNEWCEARFALLSEKLKATFGEKLQIRYKRHKEDGRCYAEFFFHPYEKWIELWLEEKEIKLWIASEFKTESVKVLGKEYKYWGCEYWDYYETDLCFNYPVDNQNIIDKIVPMLEELAKCKK